MKRIIQLFLTTAVCGSLLAAPRYSWSGPNRATESTRRPITVGDIIELNRVETLGGAQVASFSPDQTRFVILLRRGNIDKNTNDYSLELFQSDGVMQSPKPRALVSFSSSSNRPAIQDVRWLGNNSVSFLGERPGEEQQLYVVDVDSGEITRMTNHRTSVTAYAIASNGDAFFIAENPVREFLDESARRDGIIVTHQSLSDLISLNDRREAEEHETLFVKRKGSNNEVLVRSEGINPFSSYFPPPSLSPDGHYLVVKARITGAPPAEWSEYQDRFIEEGLRAGGQTLALYKFVLIDTASFEARSLLNAPTGFAHSEIVWAPNSRSVVIGGTYLPLNGIDDSERRVRQRRRFSVEIGIPDARVTPVTDEDVKLELWDRRTGILQGRSSAADRTILQYQKTGTAWQKLSVNIAGLQPVSNLKISLEEDPNTPPKLFAVDETTRKKSLVFDPNPGIVEFQLGRVEAINFKTSNGERATGSLYFPTGYIPKQRYPLVIQTHAEDLSKFMVDGPYATAFAAQPLAGKGFFVAQLPEDASRQWTPHEVIDEASAYEGVIDYLDGRGLIDRERVGIIAFSRTGLAVEYALTHSKRHFAAATLADISDAGYFRYVALLNKAEATWDSELANGGTPVGKGLATWVKNAPGFNLDRVTTPVRLEANDPGSLFFEWEWYGVLSHLGKAVELLYLPDADHVLIKPAHRLASQQGNVDWFCFWLEGQSDDDPSKTQQYKRWNDLRKPPSGSTVVVGRVTDRSSGGSRDK